MITEEWDALEKDIHIKDEGDFSTVFFTTPKAKEIAKKNFVIGGRDMSDDQVDVPNEMLYKVLGWAISHQLIVDSETNIIIPKKE